METATSDEQMVERALTGDPEAFGEIVRRWERRIFALAFGMLGREEDARDATQETAEGKQRSVAVRIAVGALPPDLRQVVVMKEFEELTFQEISDALELPLSTVKSRLYTALRQLQMRLEKFGEPAR